MKSYNEFRNEIAPRVANLCSRKGLHMSVQLLRDGTTANDEASKILIDETNYLYGHAGADCLITLTGTVCCAGAGCCTCTT